MERKNQNLTIEKYTVTLLHKFTLITGSYVHLEPCLQPCLLVAPELLSVPKIQHHEFQLQPCLLVVPELLSIALLEHHYNTPSNTKYLFLATVAVCCASLTSVGNMFFPNS